MINETAWFCPDSTEPEKEESKWNSALNSTLVAWEIPHQIYYVVWYYNDGKYFSSLF